MLKVGIDIGTSYSCVAVNNNNKTDLLNISNGQNILGDNFSIPSVAYIDKSGNVIFGQAAFEKKKLNPERFIMDFKSYFISETPVIKLEKEYKAKDLYSHFFNYFKDIIEKNYNDEIEFVCISHPVHYNLKTRAALKEIAEDIFSCNIILADELLASAIEYSEKEMVAENDTILLCNQGGSLFEVAILKKTSIGFTHLHEPIRMEMCSGNNFDKLIYDDILEKLSNDPNINTKSFIDDTSFKSHLLERANIIKHLLSFNSYRTEEFDINGKIFSYNLSREGFENLLKENINLMYEKIDKFVQASKIEKKELREILLTGGSSRIPFITTTALKHFNDKQLYVEPNPEYTVALGAATWQINQEEETKKEEKALDEAQKLLNLSFTQNSERELIDITDKQAEIYGLFRKNATIAELYGAGLIILSRTQNTEEARKITATKLEKIYKRHLHNPAIAKLFAGGLRNLSCNQAKENELKDTAERAEKIYEKFPHNPDIANQYAFILRNLSCVQETEDALEEITDKLEEITNNFPNNPEIVKLYTMGLRNLSSIQEVTEKLKITCDKLESFYNKFQGNLYIAEMFAKGLTNLSDQKNTTNNLRDITDKLEKLYIHFQDSLEIARAFASRLALLSIWQNTDTQLKPIMVRLEKLLDKFPNDPEILRDYVQTLVSLCSILHTENKKIEIVEKIENIYKSFSNNSEICCQYAKALVNLCELQQNEFEREKICKKLEALSDKFSRNQLIAEEYAKGLLKLFEKKSIIDRKSVTDRLKYLHETFPINNEIKDIYNKTRVII